MIGNLSDSTLSDSGEAGDIYRIVSGIHCVLRLCIKKVEFFIKRQFKIISFESYKNAVPQFEPNWIEDKNFVYDTAFL